MGSLLKVAVQGGAKPPEISVDKSPRKIISRLALVLLLASTFMLGFSGPAFAKKSAPDGIHQVIIHCRGAIEKPVSSGTVYLIADATSLNVSITSPENKTYPTASIPLNFTLNQAVSWIGYSLDGQTNITIAGNTTLANLAGGSHRIIVFANSTLGNVVSSHVVYFTVTGVHLWEAVLLGVIQGIAEWLPISSTGHLRLTEHFLNLTIPILFDVILHVGTLTVIFFFFRKDVKDILLALAHLDFKSENGQLIPLIIVGTIPTGLIGLVFGDMIESISHYVLPIAIALLVSGTLLFSSKTARENTDRISYKTALIFGIAQGIAIIPGLSRSGTTIAVALLLGLKREKAFRFSFLLSIPAIIGALALTFYRERHALALAGFGGPEALAGLVIAMIVGYFALRLLHKTIVDKKFYMFALYCWLLGAVLIVLSLNGF